MAGIQLASFWCWLLLIGFTRPKELWGQPSSLLSLEPLHMPYVSS